MRCSTLVFFGLMLPVSVSYSQTTYTCIDTKGDATTSTKPCFGRSAQDIQSSFGKKQSNYTVMELSPGALKAVEENTREEKEMEKARRAATATATNSTHSNSANTDSDSH
jgi:hypothetical protein